MRREWSTKRGGGQDGKGNRKTGTLAESACDFDGTVVCFGNPFANRQAKAGAFLRVRPRGIGSIKSVEDETLFIQSHADPVILNHNPGHPVVLRDTDLHDAPWR